MRKIDQARRDAAVARVRRGESITAAAAAEGMCESSVRNALKTAPAPAPTKSAPARKAPTRPVKPKALRSKRGTLEEDLEIIDEEIAANRQLLATMRARMMKEPGATHGHAAASAALTALLKRRAELRPPEKSEDDEERRWEADKHAVLSKIEESVVEIEKRTAVGPGGKAA